MAISVYRGDTLRLTVNVTGLDLTSSTVWLTVKKKETDADSAAVILKKSTSHVSETSTVFVSTSTETNTLLGDYYYDIQYMGSTGDVLTLITDSIYFKPDITRSTT